MSKNYWEKLDKFEGAQKSGENPRSHPYSRSKTEFCRPIKSRERHRPASQVPLATVEGERPEMGVKKSDADRQYRHAEAIATNPPFDTDRLELQVSLDRRSRRGVPERHSVLQVLRGRLRQQNHHYGDLRSRQRRHLELAVVAHQPPRQQGRFVPEPQHLRRWG